MTKLRITAFSAAAASTAAIALGVFAPAHVHASSYASIAAPHYTRQQIANNTLFNTILNKNITLAFSPQPGAIASVSLKASAPVW